MISGSRQKVLVIRSRIVPLLSLDPNLLGPTLITAETLPTNITDTASIPSQPLLAQPMVAVTYWKWDNEGQELISCSPQCSTQSAPLPKGPHPTLCRPHLRNRWVHSGQAHTSHRLFHGSPLGSGIPRCPGACLGTARGLSTLHLDPLGTAHIVCQRSLGNSRAPVGAGEWEGKERGPG